MNETVTCKVSSQSVLYKEFNSLLFQNTQFHNHIILLKKKKMCVIATLSIAGSHLWYTVCWTETTVWDQHQGQIFHLPGSLPPWYYAEGGPRTILNCCT